MADRMPTSDRRRAAATMMRDEDPGSVTQYDFFVWVLGMPIRDFNEPSDWSKVRKRLADFIDPTCHVISSNLYEWPDGSKTYHHELSCGHTCITDSSVPTPYCPKCGARVVPR